MDNDSTLKKFTGRLKRKTRFCGFVGKSDFVILVGKHDFVVLAEKHDFANLTGKT